MKRKGFNLVELVTVVAIIAILSSIAYSSYVRYSGRAKTKNAPACLGSIAIALENFYTNTGRYPDMIADGPQALGRNDFDCDNGYYSFSWTTDPESQYYRITVRDDVEPVFAEGALGPDVWIICSQASIPLNIESPSGLNGTESDVVCWD